MIYLLLLSATAVFAQERLHRFPSMRGGSPYEFGGGMGGMGGMGGLGGLGMGGGMDPLMGLMGPPYGSQMMGMGSMPGMGGMPPMNGMGGMGMGSPFGMTGLSRMPSPISAVNTFPLSSSGGFGSPFSPYGQGISQGGPMGMGMGSSSIPGLGPYGKK